MVDIAFSCAAASLATSSCLQNLYDLLIIRGALKQASFLFNLLVSEAGVSAGVMAAIVFGGSQRGEFAKRLHQEAWIT